MEEECKGRNIVLFSDGTGNSASNVFKTNVRRLYEALDLTDPVPPRVPRQFAFYDDGVGTSPFRPLALLGGMFGYGLARNVRDLYAFLCRTYQPGDKIYGFGFSRGAFTIRVVAGLVLHQGIVPYDGDEAKLARNVADAYRAFRREAFRAPLPAKAGRRVRDAFIAASRSVRGHDPYDPSKNGGGPGDPEADRTRIEMLGVWDTVDAYGLPFEELTRAVDRYVWPLSFQDLDLHPRVDRAFQALSLDDERRTFHPRVWNEDVEKAERITQVWFAGVHSDVGGGYADDSLAHVSLNWMADQAEGCGIRFNPDIRAHQRALADDSGPIHDPRRGLGGYYRYEPRDVAALTSESGASGFRPKVVVARPKVHRSVFRRMRDGQDGYVPLGLPPRFDVVCPVRGEPDILMDRDRFLFPGEADRARLGLPPRLDAAHPVLDKPDMPADRGRCSASGSAEHARAVARFKAQYAELQDDVRNWVWRRRLAYYVALAGTLLLFIAPLFLDAGACSSAGCFLSPLVVWAGNLLPGFVSTWLAVFAANPLHTVFFAAVVVAGLVWGGALQTRISDEMRRVWYTLAPDWAPAKPVARNNGVRSAAPGAADRLIRAVRHSRRTQRWYERLSWRILPALAIAGAGFLAFGLFSSVLLAALESGGGVCRSDTRADVPAAGAWSADFDTRMICHPVGFQVEEGVSYRLRVVTRPGPEPAPPPWEWLDGFLGVAPSARGWRDWTSPASPNGIAPGARGPVAAALFSGFTPFRRHVGEPWFKLMVRIGNQGADVYAPDWRLVPGDAAAGDIYEIDLEARRSGPLFLYVNDALPLVFVGLFYGNNDGAARVHVEPLSRTHPRRGASSGG